jgi:hypothetical protein
MGWVLIGKNSKTLGMAGMLIRGCGFFFKANKIPAYSSLKKI